MRDKNRKRGRGYSCGRWY